MRDGAMKERRTRGNRENDSKDLKKGKTDRKEK